MHQLHPVVSVVLDTRRANKKKLYPVKLCATFQVIKAAKKIWVQKYYPLKVHCSKADFAATKSNPRTTRQKDIKIEIVKAQAKANQILKSHTYVNIELFETLYNSAGSLQAVGSVFDLKIEELKKEGRIGSADIYRGAKNSILRFSPDLTFSEISPDWIRKYSTWLQSHKDGEETVTVSPTTIGIYLRHLRAVYNLAVRMRLINADMYPFGRGGYVIKKTKSRKIALSEVDKNRLLLIHDPELRLAVDFWLMSYYCYGLNMMDIALLRVMDLRDDIIIISRHKTMNTDSGNELVIPIRKEVKEVILRHGNKTLNPKDYVFPILSIGLTPSQVKYRVKDFTKRINKGLKKVQEKLNLEIRLTTYTARHTFAMMALRKGASKEFIQEALGHALPATTESYLSGFDIDAKRAISDKL